MAMQYFDQTVTQNDFNAEDKPSLEKWKSVPGAISRSIGNPACGFDCNICLESVQDPVITLCGHLFCWPCIYKWLQYQTDSTENGDQQHQQCPVCKSEVSQTTLVPLYGRGQTTKPSKDKTPHLGIIIPQRPRAPSCSIDGLTSPMPMPTPSPRPPPQQLQPSYTHLTSYVTSPTTVPNLFELMIGTFGDGRISGNLINNIPTYPNSYDQAGIYSPRVIRHVIQADKSLSRIWLFLVSCIFLCLVLF